VNQVSVEYDADLWIRVPLDYVDTRWADAAQWAEWIAGEATRGRPDAETIAPVVRSEADAEPAAMPRIEWLGVARDWVCYVATDDHDPAAVNARVIDADVLFAAVGEAARASRHRTKRTRHPRQSSPSCCSRPGTSSSVPCAGSFPPPDTGPGIRSFGGLGNPTYH
jgi:hypothetical protein